MYQICYARPIGHKRLTKQFLDKRKESDKEKNQFSEFTKGHLISKCLFGVLKFFQKRTKTSRPEVSYLRHHFDQNSNVIIVRISALVYHVIYKGRTPDNNYITILVETMATKGHFEIN